MGCFSGIVKYLLFVFNLLIVICGIIFVVVGALLIADEGKGLKSFTHFSVGGFAVAVGIIIFLIAFFGCCGAIKENGCMLTTYAIILIVLLILQVVLGAMAFVSIKNDDHKLEKEVRKTVEEIFTNSTQQEVIDNAQEAFKCCGVDGPNFWPSIKKDIPKSCCDSQPCTLSNSYQKGCVDAFIDVVSGSIKIIGGIALAFAAVELLGAIFACIVKNRI